MSKYGYNGSLNIFFYNVAVMLWADLELSHFMGVNLLLQHFFGRHHRPLGSGDGDGAFPLARVGCRHTGTRFIKFELCHLKLLNSCEYVVEGTKKYVIAESKTYRSRLLKEFDVKGNVLNVPIYYTGT
jgi:hypothetical protein